MRYLNEFTREDIEEMAADLRHRAKLEREVHNDYKSSKYLDNVALVVDSVVDLYDYSLALQTENKKLKQIIAELRDNDGE